MVYILYSGVHCTALDTLIYWLAVVKDRRFNIATQVEVDMAVVDTEAVAAATEVVDMEAAATAAADTVMMADMAVAEAEVVAAAGDAAAAVEDMAHPAEVRFGLITPSA